MRPSSYNIYVPLPDGPDDCLIVQGYTGAVDWISGSVARYLQAGASGSDVPSAKTLETLAQRGYLTSRTEEEETAYMLRLAVALHRRHCQAAAFLFAPSFSCQLRCVYCFEAAVVHRYEETSQASMTGEQVDAAYAAMDRIVTENGKQRPNEVTLYGGEPLMARNHDLVTYLVEEGIRRGYRFRAITNGLELETYEHLLDKDKINYLQITLDGPPELHDRRRLGKGGQSTFHTICANVDLALAKGCTVVLRTNVDRRNLDGLDELTRLYQARGWSNQPHFYPYANIVHGSRAQGVQLQPLELLEKGLSLSNQVADGYQPITVDFGIGQVFGGLLRKGRLPALHSYFCGANIGSYIFGPDGAIYSCWDEVGTEEGRIGRYYPELTWNTERIRQWSDRTIANMPACHKCPWALLCGGGCTHQAREATGSYFSSFCWEFPEAFRRIAPSMYRRFEQFMAASAPEASEPQQAETCA